MHKAKDHLKAIITNKLLTPLFQPIVSLEQNNIFGYEALIRGPSDSPLHNPINLFSAANRFQQSVALENTCREVSIRQFKNFALTQKLFLNVSPSVLLDPSFKKGRTLQLLEQAGLKASQIVIELTEQQPTENYSLMQDAVMHYREMGFEIALDDLGAGYSGLRLWTELLPDYVKIDRHFIQDINIDPVKLNFVSSIKKMAFATNCHVIAEGIETREEYNAIVDLGISHGQGYYFSRPAAQPVKELNPSIFIQKKQADFPPITQSTKIIDVIQQVDPVAPSTPINKVLTIFQKNSHLTTLPLVDNDRPVGIIYKEQFLSRLFASPYGIDLHGKEPIQSFIDTLPMIFECQESIEQVSQQLTNNLSSDTAFIVIENGIYRGVGTMKELLQVITDQQLQNAKHANPLTHLPGVTPINHIINKLLSHKKEFVLGYFDLDNFKPFNDLYGYDKGDQAIQLVANLLKETINKDFGYIGHIGGDDFIVIFTTAHWEKLCQNILNSFKQTVIQLYCEQDQKAGGIHSVDRRGNPCFYPVLSLSIGLVEEKAIAECNSHIEVSDLAAESKHQAKEIEGNSYFVNRRAVELPFTNAQAINRKPTKQPYLPN